MSIRIQADHKTEGVSHHWFPDGRFGTLRFGGEGLANTLYLDTPGDIDEVIAELVALRAEMTAEPEPAADCGYTWAGADGLPHACTREVHAGGEHEAWASDGTRLVPGIASGYRLACGCTDRKGCVCSNCQDGKVHQPGDVWYCGEHNKTTIVLAVAA